jgi:hypothetical protein
VLVVYRAFLRVLRLNAAPQYVFDLHIATARKPLVNEHFKVGRTFSSFQFSAVALILMPYYSATVS